MKTRLQTGSPRAGFSLIELMAVIVILSILMAFIVTRLGGQGEVVKAQMTSSFLRDIDIAISEYELEFGAYPKSRFNPKWDIGGNGTNIGAEALVLSLWSNEWGGTTLPTDSLDNSDGDSTRKPVAQGDVIGNELMELSDNWENPIAYFHRSDYGEKQIYVTADGATGDPVEAEVEAMIDPKTGAYYNPRKYQLISAGEDGLFGTEDDLTNFKKRD